MFSIMISLSSSVWSGPIDGKSLICNQIDGVFGYGFRFENNLVKGDLIAITNDEASILEFGSGTSYTSSIDEIKWWDGFWILDRKTLYLIDKDDTSPHQCEVILNLSNYREKLNIFKDKSQSNYNDKLNENKI